MCPSIHRAVVLATFLLVLGVLARPAAAANTVVDELSAALQVEIDRQSDLRAAAAVEDSIWREVRDFYRRRAYRFLWSEELTPRPMAEELVEAIREAKSFGLSPGDYGEERLRALISEARDPASLAVFDVLATEAFVRYGLHLARGRVQPTSVDPNWRVAPRRAGVWEALASANGGEPVNQALFALEPRSRLYAKTKEAYASLLGIAERGGWGVVPPGPDLHPGQKDARVEALRRRLVAGGFLPSKARKGKKFDTALEGAVRDFQAAHLIPVTGVVDSATVAALDVPVEERIHQLALNLERARWMEDDPPGVGVFVNVPDFALTVVDGGKELLHSKVITGRYYHPTPVLNDSIVTVVANPTWSVPQSIATLELLPAVQRDSSYFTRKGFRVFTRERRGLREIDPLTVNWKDVTADKFRYQLRQDAGPENPLGRVKFVLTNDQYIYLHDTPSVELFERADRTGSYGCIRVEKPFELASLVLAQGDRAAEWDSLMAGDSLATTETRSLAVKPAIPVRVTYWTAWANGDGEVEWRTDPYRIDYLHDWALKNRYQPDPFAAAEAGSEPAAASAAPATGGEAAAASSSRRPARR